jgi:hypothetical protein
MGTILLVGKNWGSGSQVSSHKEGADGGNHPSPPSLPLQASGYRKVCVAGVHEVIE